MSSLDYKMENKSQSVFPKAQDDILKCLVVLLCFFYGSFLVDANKCLLLVGNNITIFASYT